MSCSPSHTHSHEHHHSDACSSSCTCQTAAPACSCHEASPACCSHAPDSTCCCGHDHSGGHTPWKRLMLAACLAVGSEIMEFIPASESGSMGIVLDWLSPLLAALAILLGGTDTFIAGWRSLKALKLNMNTLMVIAVTGAFIIGQWPEAATVMVLFTLAEALENKSIAHAHNAIQGLMELSPERATVLSSDGTWKECETKDIHVDMLVRVRPGERVAMDGIVTEGQSAVNQSPITGESMPVSKGPGDTVFAGTINESGSFIFKVTAEAGSSTLSRILASVENAQANRARVQRFVDRFARVYTPAVVIAAVFFAIIPPLLLGGGWKEWIYRALTLLVISCPCALVISTPVTIISGLAAATRHGILIKGGKFLELGRNLRCIALDKTGTLTAGKPVLTDCVSCGSLNTSQALLTAAGLASRSDHPISAALSKAAVEQQLDIPEVTTFAALPGQGIEGTISGARWQLGSARFAEKCGIVSARASDSISALEAQGKSVVLLIGPDNTVEAVFAVADTLKKSSPKAIADLRSLGVKTVLLSGDNAQAAQAAGQKAGVDEVMANMLPQDKLDAVEKLSRHGLVGMAGDGINDAPALARADIGFAMGAAGTDAAIETADVALMDDDPSKLATFIRLSRATHAILMQNVIFTIGVKAAFFAMALAGEATMWMAVFADIGTSLLVVGNGLRMLRH